MRGRPPRLVRALYRVVAGLAPRRIHDHYGPEQRRLFERLWIEECPRRPIGAVIWVAGHLWRASRASVGSRLDARRARRASHASGLRARRPSVAILADLRQAARLLWRSPWYTGTVMFVLASSFSLSMVALAVTDGVLFKPLPYQNAGELHLVHGVQSAAPDAQPPLLSAREVVRLIDAVPEVASIVLRDDHLGNLARIDGVPYGMRRVHAGFLEVLGIRPIAGAFEPDDFTTGARSPFVPTLISHRLWVAHFGADPGIVNRRVVRDERAGLQSGWLIRGVLPPDFVFPLMSPSRTDALTPERSGGVRQFAASGSRHYRLLVRIGRGDRPSVEPRLQAALTAFARNPPPPSETDLEDDANAAVVLDQVRLVPVGEHLAASSRSAFALILTAAAGLLLLACLNVAGLTTARALERHQEIRVRRALGASSWAIVRSRLAEAGAVTLAAMVLACAASRPLLAVTVSLLPESVILLKPVAIDTRVLLGAGLIAIVACLVIAAWPALTAARSSRLAPGDPHGVTASRGTRRAQLALVAGQAALGFVLFTAGGVTLASLAAALTADVGYRQDHVGFLEVFVSRSGSDAERRDQLTAARNAIGDAAGVEAVAATSIPMFFGRAPYTSVVAAGLTERPPNIGERRVDRAFFDITGLQVVSGALPPAHEWTDDSTTAVVSQTAARAFWPGREPIGQRLVPFYKNDQPKSGYLVAAVVRDARYEALDQPPVGDVYLPGAVGPGTSGTFVLVRTAPPARDVLPAIARMLTARGLRVDRAVAIEDALFVTARHRALPAWLFGSLGIAAVVTLAVGMLGLLGMSTAQRSRELVIRLALGATPRRVVGIAAREHLIALGGGLAAGAGLGLLAARALESDLYEVSAYDPRVWAATALVMVLVGVAGTIIPASRAARLDPAQALKVE